MHSVCQVPLKLDFISSIIVHLPPTSQALRWDHCTHIHCDGNAQTIYRAALVDVLVLLCQFCFEVDTLHFVIFFFKCLMIPNFGHSLSFTDGFLALHHCLILNVAVCVRNNSPCGKMSSELSRPHNTGDRN